MCLPVVALAATAVAGMVSTYAKVQQANTQAAFATANANNERVAAAQDQTSMNQAALTRYQQISQVEGEQRAAQAANGAQVDFGSSAAQVASTAVEGAMDVNRIYQTGFQAQHGHDVNITNDLAAASAARSQALFAGIGGAIGTAGSVLGQANQYGMLSSKMGIPAGGGGAQISGFNGGGASGGMFG